MSFKKIGGIFKIISSETLNSYDEWAQFKKQASKDVARATVVAEEKVAIEKEGDIDIVAAIDTENFIYVHSTIMAGVRTADKDYWITPETEKFINDNHDAWTCDDLLKDHVSFKTATTFVEHVQELEKAKGKCLDVIARKLPDTVLIDVLFSVAKRHNDLVENIKTGIINAVSMGCSTEMTICSICGNEAKDSSQYCYHIKNQKGRMVKCADGKMRKAAELCKNNTFFDISLVANPAFIGAIFRKILSTSDQINSHILANLINNKIEAFVKEENTFLKAASIDPQENVEIVVKKDGQVDIKANNQEINGGQKLPEDEMENLRQVLANEKTATKFLSRIIKRLFNKDSGYHPIINTVENKNFAVDYDSYTNIPTPFPQQRFRDAAEAQIELRIISDVEEGIFTRIARTTNFECYKCGYKDELWQVKASSIDNGFEDVVVCPECGFMTEKQAINIKKPIKISSLDRLQLKDLGYSSDNLEKLSNEQIKNILTQNVKKSDFNKSNSYLRLENIVNQLKSGLKVIANKDIPVDNDEGVLHFDEHGASVITKDEHLTFIGAVENGSYGLFKTELGEEFFMPLKKNPS